MGEDGSPPSELQGPLGPHGRQPCCHQLCLGLGSGGQGEHSPALPEKGVHPILSEHWGASPALGAGTRGFFLECNLSVPLPAAEFMLHRVQDWKKR